VNRVSVIIPTFNGAATLHEAISSIRAQNVSHEIIVVDDGSTDATPRLDLGEVIRIRQDNRGPAAARNAGLTRATSPFVAFLDDDDLWLPEKLRLQVGTLEAHPEALATIGLSTCDLDAPRSTFFQYQLGAALMRREAFDRFGGFDARLPGSEDVDWFLRVRDGGRLVRTEDLVQIVRRDGGNITRGKTLAELGFHKVVQRSIERRRARPLVSVIIAVHNGASHLEAAIGSVRTQDYAPIEIIVVDDGSTDDSPRIAARLGAIVLCQENSGPGAARNRGVAHARGEIVAFLDQDDLWQPAKIRRQVEALTAQPDQVSLVLTDYLVENEIPRWFKQELLDAPHPGWAPSALAVRRETFLRVGLFDERFRAGSDMDWFIRAKEMGLAIETIDEPLLRRRIHERNDSAEPHALRDMFGSLHQALRRRRTQGPSPS
jgi:glycosyltransferase involved in cell wall biosynthesis